MKVRVRRAAVVALIASAAASLAAGSAQAAVSLVPVGSFDTPIYATAPRGAVDDLYVVERGGAIRVVHQGVTRSEPFLTVTGLSQDGEGGLLSMAFATDYSTSGRFYVYITPDGTGRPNAPIVVREYRRSASDPYRADPATARDVLTVPHDRFANHYGGTLQFGPDGRLYVGTGDGGSGGDPSGNAQNLDSPLGKLLRIDPRATGSAPYGVPADNPYAGTASRQAVWSTGLRNPFRFSFDRGTGDLLIGDVGQERYEEIDRVSGAGAGRGVNFGWNRCEGTATYPSGALGSCPLTALTPPVFAYGHQGRCSITGGVVSRDPGVEELAGRYLYGDFCDTAIRTLGGGADDAPIAPTVNQPAAFGEDACGRVIVVSLGGPVSRISDGSDGGCALQAEFTPGAASPAQVVPPAATPPAATPVAAKLRLATRVSARQKVLKRRSLAIRVRCSAACSLRVKGRLAVSGRRSLALKDFTRRRVGTGTKTFRVPVGRKGRAAIRSALRAKRRATITLAIRVRGTTRGAPVVVKRVRVRIVG